VVRTTFVLSNVNVRTLAAAPVLSIQCNTKILGSINQLDSLDLAADLVYTQ
jgi:hypothetical protein